MKIKRLTKAALLTAVALALFIVELQIPVPAPIPGIKLGLANIITVYAVFALSPIEAGLILLARILLGSFFAGNLMSLLYSFVGGLFCFFVMLLMKKIVSENQIWVCSIIGAMAHNIGQITVAILLTKTLAVVWYLPLLLLSGMITGLFTGICAQITNKRINKNVRG